MASIISISIPEKLKAKVDEYNKENPYEKINISQVAQAAIYGKLVEMGKA